MRLVQWFSMGLLLVTTGVFAAHGQDVPPRTTLVVPGQRVGQILIGTPQQDNWKVLGKPMKAGKGIAYREDAWKQGKETLCVTNRLDTSTEHYFVSGVEFMSPAFHTRDGIGIGSTWADIHRRLPQVKRNLNVEPVPVAKGWCYEYRDDKAGILFHIQRAKNAAEETGRCTQITVYKPF